MLAIAAALALLWALRRPLPQSLALYLKAQLAYIPPVMLTYWLAGPGTLYAAVYSLLTAYILLTALWIVYVTLVSRDYALRGSALAVLIALLFGRVAYVGLDRGMGFADWVVLIEAAVLVWCGTMIGTLAPYTPDRNLSLALSFTWLGQALFDFGFLLYDSSPLWARLNYAVPPLVMIALCLWIGLRNRALPAKAS